MNPRPAYRGDPFRFDNTHARELTGCYAPVTPATVPAPEILQFNHALAAELGPALSAAVFAGIERGSGAAD